jgi:GNAT superfamily N-acetyltransferase
VEAARRAAPEDAEQLAKLHADVLAELAAQERGGRVFTSFDAPATLDGLEVWVGTYDDAVVGFGTGRTALLRDGGKLGIVDLLYVDPGARGVGVGEALMEELLAWFRSEGCFGVDTMALPGMRETKNFFEEQGFSARLLVVHHRFDA